jgi:Rieske Fe-S protein
MIARVLLSVIMMFAVLAPTQTAEPEKFGAGVSLSEVTPITGVIQRPADYEGKTVRVEGVVTAVCTHMGCWMALAPEQATDAKTLFLKVDDGVIVFPVSAKGKRVAAQGVVERIGTSAESREAAREHAEHTGTKAEAAAQYQLKGTGALIY